MPLIRSAKVKNFVHLKGKRCSPSFINYLELKVKEEIIRHINYLGSAKKTLNMEDAVTADALLKRR